MALPLDVAKLREAIKGPGIDPRYWVSYGTVGTVGDDGIPDFTDTAAIHVAPDGVYVDVVLQPSQLPVTARYPGMAGGTGVQAITPVRAGDEVLVVLPDGSPNGPPVIAVVLNSASNKVPLGDDRRPVFKNDRVLIYATGVPLDIRTGEGAQVTLDGPTVTVSADAVAVAGDTVDVQGDEVTVTSDDVKLGGAAAFEKVIKGTSYTLAEKTLLAALSTFTATCVTIPPSAPAAALAAAIAAFSNLDFLSGTTKTE